MLDETPETVVAAPVETVETEVVTDAIEQPIEPLEAAQDAEIVAEEVPTEEVVDEVIPEVVETVSVTFDTTAELAALVEQVNGVLDKYELPAEVSAAFDALKTKAEGTPADILGEYSVYGNMDEVKSLLERQSHLYSQREENGSIRPNTDKFAEEVNALDPDQASWLQFDLNRLPSQRYANFNKFQELIIDALALPSDTPQSVIARYEKFVGAMQTGALPANGIPDYIPEELHTAFNSLPKESREELEAMSTDETYDYSSDRLRKVAELRMIQEGIDARGERAKTLAQTEQANRVAFSTAVHDKQEAFFDTFRETTFKNLTAKVQFSPDTKQQSLLAAQNISLLGDACLPGKTGDVARQALTDAGVTFDFTRAQQLSKAVELASISLVKAQTSVNAQGEPLDKLAFNKAVKEFDIATRGWQDLADDVIDQQARLVSTGNAQAVKDEAAKIKIAPKARVVSKGVGTPATKEAKNPHPYGTRPYYEYQADETQMAIEARKARTYQPV